MKNLNANPRLRPALALAICLLGPPTAHCFCSVEAHEGDRALSGPASLRATASVATKKPFRFSTKYQDEEAALLYYGFRYYNASTGRWLSRDPIGERGGENEYAFVANEPVTKIDRLGNVKVIYPASRSGDVRDVRAEITWTVAASDVCHGGPINFKVSIDADYDAQGARGLHNLSSAFFTFDSTRVYPTNERTTYPEDPTQAHMAFDLLYSKSLLVCPRGRQSGGTHFDMGDYGETLFTLIVNWRYRCDCACNEVEPFKLSSTYFVFPPLKIPAKASIVF